MKKVIIYTDGSCNNRTHNNGGYGIVLLYGEYKKEISFGQYINSTSARCELYAVLNGLNYGLIINTLLEV